MSNAEVAQIAPWATVLVEAIDFYRDYLNTTMKSTPLQAAEWDRLFEKIRRLEQIREELKFNGVT